MKILDEEKIEFWSEFVKRKVYISTLFFFVKFRISLKTKTFCDSSHLSSTRCCSCAADFVLANLFVWTNLFLKQKIYNLLKIFWNFKFWSNFGKRDEIGAILMVLNKKIWNFLWISIFWPTPCACDAVRILAPPLVCAYRSNLIRFFFWNFGRSKMSNLCQKKWFLNELYQKVMQLEIMYKKIASRLAE